jgi:hypothetical protein
VEPGVPAPRWGESSAPGAGAGATSFAEATGTTSGRPVDDYDDDEDDDDEARPRHPYTWLHLIVLALVAFVLGFLITLLLTKEPGGGAKGAAPVTPDTTTSSPVAGSAGPA